jgi:uncharacterized protein YkwD
MTRVLVALAKNIRSAMENKNGLSNSLAIIIILIAAFVVFTPVIYLKFTASFNEDEIVFQTNVQRVKNGLASLSRNKILDEMAEAKAKDMFEKQYFEHVSPSGFGLEDLAKAYKYNYLEVGENLLEGNFYDEQQVVDRWMNSPAHRENILNKNFTEIGVAAVKGKYQGKTVWMLVQEFGLSSPTF